MHRNRPAQFKGRHFEAEIIILCVRWYLRFGLSFRNLEEMMAEQNLIVDHVTIWRWVQRYAPELHRRCRPELRITNRSWRVDETYLRLAAKWTYLYRAVDSTGATIDFLLSPKRRSEEHTSELQSRPQLVCRLLLEKKKSLTLESEVSRRRLHGRFARISVEPALSDDIQRTDAPPCRSGQKHPTQAATYHE